MYRVHLLNEYGLPIHTWDEQYPTEEAALFAIAAHVDDVNEAHMDGLMDTTDAMQNYLVQQEPCEIY